MQILAICETAERERSPQESYREAQKYDKNAEHGNGNSSGFEVQKRPMVGGENRAALMRLELLADFRELCGRGDVAPSSFHENDPGTVVPTVVSARRRAEGTGEGSEKTVGDERLASAECQNQRTVFPKQVFSFAKAFERVHVIV